MTLTPAYGRDYNTAVAVRKDLAAGKDFIINEFGNRWDGKPTNKDQLTGSGLVKIRYRKLTQVIVEEF